MVQLKCAINIREADASLEMNETQGVDDHTVGNSRQTKLGVRSVCSATVEVVGLIRLD